MFSKALFKQSCKANGTMWAIITFAVCFMLACVMLISGNGNIGQVKGAISDTIIIKEIDSQMEEKAISYYANAEDGLKKFDSFFLTNAEDTLSYLLYFSKVQGGGETEEWQVKTDAGKSFADSVSLWLADMPEQGNYDDISEYMSAIELWKEKTPATQENAIIAAYTSACEEIQAYISEKISEAGYNPESTEAQELLGCIMYTLNPVNSFDDYYTGLGEEVPGEYDFMSLVNHIASGDAAEYLESKERNDYRGSRAEKCMAIFLAGNMTGEETVGALLEALSGYGVTAEKYESFGYTYESVRHMANTAVVTYRGRLEYETGLVEKTENEEEYLKAVEEKKASIAKDVSSSFLSTLPEEVSEAIEEIGQMDLYTLIVGSIFYKLAGLLLPIIYMIMTSNNLIAGQVDSGSMAYVLSTSTKRSTVAFTQAVYLIGSLFAMFSLTTATGCVCLSLVTEEVELTCRKLVMLNTGAFLVLLALSGLCFFTSCIFDRSKHSMAIGGGLSIFALVAAMLGLFGSPVIPSVVRLEALNNFNYATVISLFDVISIIDGTNDFIWKFCILGAAGIAGYVAGSLRFTKKDLPL